MKDMLLEVVTFSAGKTVKDTKFQKLVFSCGAGFS